MHNSLAAWLWALTVLFAARVFGQALQHWAPLPFLPAFDDFQGSRLPYEWLLAIQLLILGLMVRTTWRIQRHSLVRSRRVGSVLWWGGWIYLAGSVVRIAVGLVVPDAHLWFRTWIPAMFHLVLAAFMLQVACYHLRELSLVENRSTDT